MIIGIERHEPFQTYDGLENNQNSQTLFLAELYNWFKLGSGSQPSCGAHRIHSGGDQTCTVDED